MPVRLLYILSVIMIIFIIITIIIIETSQSLVSVDSSHVVQVGLRQTNGDINFICGGSYIGKNVIVLGAHCTNKSGREPDLVRITSTNGNTFDIRIHNFTIHYRYKPKYDYHNMAVAFLDRNPQSLYGIKPACVLYPHPISNTPVQLIGPVNGRLERTDLIAVGSEKCHEYYNPNRKLRFGVLLCCFCARNPNTNQCTDLHSSPLQIIVKRSGKEVPFLIGHKSIGKSCGVKTPAIYTRYGSYYEWLETVTKINLDENG